MKNSKKIWAAVAAVLAFTGIAGGAMAKHRSDGSGFVGRISDDLTLNASQQAQLDAMWNEVQVQRQQMRDAAAEKIRAAVTQDSLSREDVLALMEMRRQHREEVQNLMAEKISEFHGQLDASQREQLAAMAPQMLTRGRGDDDGRHGWFHHGSHHGDRDGHRGWFGWWHGNDNDQS